MVGSKTICRDIHALYTSCTGGGGDENKSEAEKNKVVSIMAEQHRMGEYSTLSSRRIFRHQHEITFKRNI